MQIVPGPVPVRIVNPPSDLTGWLSLAAAVVALVLAVAAIWQTRRQGIAASKQINIERRKVFELEILRDLLALDSVKQIWEGRSVALVEALPHADLTLWRSVIPLEGLHDWSEAKGQQLTEILDNRGVPPNENWAARLWQALVDDVKASIRRRVQDG
jgi:hypothetical protein